MANLAAVGSAQGLMQSRSGEYVNQDLQRQKLAQETNDAALKPIDDYLNKKQEKAKNEEQEISKFIEFKEPVLPKDEEDRLAEASSIVKMIKDKADRKEIEMAKLKFYSNDLDRVSQRKRSDNDIKLAMSKPDEYKITGNVYSPTSKAEYKAKFGTDKYDTSHAIGENYVGDDTEWIIKKMPSFKEQSSKGLNKSETVEGTSFADEDTRMMWESSTINQMLDGVTPQSKSFLKKTTKEVLDADPELEYYPEELDAVVKQVASGKILSVWDSQKQLKTIDNNAPISGKGLENNINIGGGGENAQWKFGTPKPVTIREGKTNLVARDKYGDEISNTPNKKGNLVEYDYISMQTKTPASNPAMIVEGSGKGVHYQGVYKKNGGNDIAYFKFTENADGTGSEILVPKDKLKASTYADIKTNVGENDFEKAAAIGKYAPKKETTKANNETPLIKSKEEFDKLPKGTLYKKADGKTYKKG